MSKFFDGIKTMGIKGSGFIERVKAELAAVFWMVDMGPFSFYLGLKVKRDREQRTIKLSQPADIDRILEKIPLRQSEFGKCGNERRGSSPTKNGRRSLYHREGKISRNDWIIDVLNRRNQTWYRLRHASSKPIFQKPITSTCQTRQNNLPLVKRFQR